jgi:hypothetical protein
MEVTPFQLANNTVLSLSDSNFILPKDRRPILSEVINPDSIPIINLNENNIDDGHASSLLVSNISRACEEYGFFQIVNHGVPQELCQRVLAVVTEFFQLPHEERAQFFTTDHTKQVKVYNYYQKVEGHGKVTMWSETFTHPYHPLDDFTHFLPTSIPQYRYDHFTFFLFFFFLFYLFLLPRSLSGSNSVNLILFKHESGLILLTSYMICSAWLIYLIFKETQTCQ